MMTLILALIIVALIAVQAVNYCRAAAHVAGLQSTIGELQTEVREYTHEALKLRQAASSDELTVAMLQTHVTLMGEKLKAYAPEQLQDSAEFPRSRFKTLNR